MSSIRKTNRLAVTKPPTEEDMFIPSQKCQPNSYKLNQFRGYKALSRLQAGKPTALLVSILTALTALPGCGSNHSIGGQALVAIESSEHVIRVENPIIEFCERLHPPILHPDELERETLIVECLKLCQSSDSCNIIIPELPGSQPTSLPSL